MDVPGVEQETGHSFRQRAFVQGQANLLVHRLPPEQRHSAGVTVASSPRSGPHQLAFKISGTGTLLGGRMKQQVIRMQTRSRQRKVRCEHSALSSCAVAGEVCRGLLHSQDGNGRENRRKRRQDQPLRPALGTAPPCYAWPQAPLQAPGPQD